MYSEHAHSYFQNALLSLDGSEFVEIKKSSHWMHSGIAICECSNVMENIEIDQIGAERQYHNYSGILHEVIVYDRKLAKEEKKIILQYFFNKYYGSWVKTTFTNLQYYGELSKELIICVLSFGFPNGLMPYCKLCIMAE